MDDFDCVMTVNSTKSSLDSGFDNGFLSDSSSSSSKSDSCATTPATCVFEETATGTRHSYHRCALNVYNLSGRGIETLSTRTFLYFANCVRELDLSRNKIRKLPDSVGELQNLQELNLSCNELRGVPHSCGRLQKLQVLNLSQNKLTEPPLCLELGMERITHLDLSINFISKFPNPPKCLLSLQCLNLSHNCLNLLPLWLFGDQCRSISELDVSFNFCFDNTSLRTKLPLMQHHRTSALKCLKKLWICNTGINPGIVSPLKSFERLQSVHMGNLLGSESTLNRFLEIDINLFYSPENIVELHLPKIGLAGLPQDICRFRSLEVLDASCNPLDWLPETFVALTSLRELVMSDCNLAYLPENFGQLTSLKKLVLDHNKLTDVRRSLDSLASLEWLDVYDNSLEELPVSREQLRSLHMVDLAYNYINLESVLDVEVNGESLCDVYLRQQARLREAGGGERPRNSGGKVPTNTPSWDSLESLYKSHRSNSLSDISQAEENYSFQYCNSVAEDVLEENWDEESSNENDEFEPDSVYRFHLPLGLYQFGWTPPVKRRECPVPINQQASGFVFVPGQWHQRTTIRRRRRRVRDQPVAEGQFDDAGVDRSAGLHQADSLGELLRRMCMFVRNPAGLRTKRRCRFHGPYEDCLHHGLWYRLCPPTTFHVPDTPLKDDS